MPTTLFLCGDVMTGRGVDQVLARPGDPTIHEDGAGTAEAYVQAAERVSGPIPRGVADDWIWGDALADMRRADVRIVNLETAVTTSGAWEPKGINYRMHPANVGVLRAAEVDVCVLANNHVLDWGPAGLVETLEVLRGAGLRTVGAGRDAAEAEAPAIVARDGGRVLVFAVGHRSSGVPLDWAAGPGQPGVAVVPDLRDVAALGARIERWRRPGDLVVVSIHWGGNWGWRLPDAHRAFAHALVDDLDVHVVHGHSSHHPLGVEVRRGRPILYGAGDFVDDYEGIRGYEVYRPELRVGWQATLHGGELTRLELAPYRERRFRLERADAADASWLASVLDAESAPLGARVSLGADLRLRVEG